MENRGVSQLFEPFEWEGYEKNNGKRERVTRNYATMMVKGCILFFIAFLKISTPPHPPANF